MKVAVDEVFVEALGERFEVYVHCIYVRENLVQDFITTSVQSCHVELTTLIIPGQNDSEQEMRELSTWVAGLEKQYNKKIPLHITRFFPTFKLTDREPTPVSTIMNLVKIAKENLEFVFAGNV